MSVESRVSSVESPVKALWVPLKMPGKQTRTESGRAQPHSKTLRRFLGVRQSDKFWSVLCRFGLKPFGMTGMSSHARPALPP